jgi:hypothetical protein
MRAPGSRPAGLSFLGMDSGNFFTGRELACPPSSHDYASGRSRLRRTSRCCICLVGTCDAEDEGEPLSPSDSGCRCGRGRHGKEMAPRSGKARGVQRRSGRVHHGDGRLPPAYCIYDVARESADALQSVALQSARGDVGARPWPPGTASAGTDCNELDERLRNSSRETDRGRRCG